MTDDKKTETSEEKKEEKPKDKKKIKVSGKLKTIIEEVEKLTVLELADLVKALEDKFGVSGVPMTASAVPVAGAPADPQAQQEEKAIFDVIMTQAGSSKIQVIKAIRKLKPDLGLQDAKKMTEEMPQEVLKEAKKKDAEDAKKLLEEAGAVVELK